jgi:hypothetical protein
MRAIDRVRETTSTTGTGALVLDGEDVGYQAVGDVLADGESAVFAVALGAQWEVGIYTYSLSGNSLSRDKVTASSNAGALVDFAAGAKKVWIDHSAYYEMTRLGVSACLAHGIGVV